MKEILSDFSCLLMAFSYIPFIYGMMRKTKPTKPIKTTWFIWSCLNTILMASMYFGNSLNKQIIGATFGTWIVFFFSLKYGMPGWKRIDKFCLASAAIAIALWQMFDNPLIGIMASLGAISIGTVPTMTSIWEDPSRESKLAWTFNWFSCLCMLLAIPQWTLAKASQPTVYFILSTIIMVALYRPRSSAE